MLCLQCYLLVSLQKSCIAELSLVQWMVEPSLEQLMAELVFAQVGAVSCYKNMMAIAIMQQCFTTSSSSFFCRRHADDHCGGVTDSVDFSSC